MRPKKYVNNVQGNDRKKYTENKKENKNMYIDTLKKMNGAGLCKIANELKLDDISGLRKQEVIFRILKAQA
ncbi:MAG: hypothetical protein DRP78_02675, partial [Candidatus Omnitrophota bacterium]